MHSSRIVIALLLVFGFACSSDDDTAPPADATPSVDADPNAPDAMPSSALGFLDACVADNDLCDTTMDLACFSFRNKGPHCTHSCSGPSDCEAPSPGCNGMGVCKVP